MLHSLARNAATHASLSTIVHDTGADGDPIRRETVAGYLEELTRLMAVEGQPAWQPHLRSKAALRSGPKRHFVDPSLAVAALRALRLRLHPPGRNLGDPDRRVGAIGGSPSSDTYIRHI